ncbi:D-sedoheptulose 7-phosphate isomerase [Poseidonibacter sp.]|uniref:D-sedoheptulose 7-phosphate isomerase n=1 Tax=Poseidonibacter sp. TaxID=2321188 RepID=UPI003C74E152
MKQTISKEFQSHLETINNVINNMEDKLVEASTLVVNTLKNGNKILLCGNGGSAADAQHIAAEITGNYKSIRRGLPAIALTTDTSAITAISNDNGYEMVFNRQIEALANKGDLIIGISTSGNSKNILNALKVAKELGCNTLGFSGNKGGNINEVCDVNLIVPSDDTPRIQEMHILFGHTICQIIDDEFC